MADQCVAHVVSDGMGFVGAFLTAAEVEAKVFRRYPLNPFVVQRFALDPAGPFDVLWLVLYHTVDVVAFASNSREAAQRAHRALAGVGTTYEGELERWRQPLGRLNSLARSRLEVARRSQQCIAGDAFTAGGGDKAALFEKMMFGGGGGGEGAAAGEGEGAAAGEGAAGEGAATAADLPNFDDFIVPAVAPPPEGSPSCEGAPGRGRRPPSPGALTFEEALEAKFAAMQQQQAAAEETAGSAEPPASPAEPPASPASPSADGPASPSAAGPASPACPAAEGSAAELGEQTESSAL